MGSDFNKFHGDGIRCAICEARNELDAAKCSYCGCRLPESPQAAARRVEEERSTKKRREQERLRAAKEAAAMEEAARAARMAEERSKAEWAKVASAIPPESETAEPQAESTYRWDPHGDTFVEPSRGEEPRKSKRAKRERSSSAAPVTQQALSRPAPPDPDPGWWQDAGGVWHHQVRGSWMLDHAGNWRSISAPASQAARTGGGCSTVAIISIAAVTLIGGCSFIVTEPVIALAIFFVGIPFTIFVLWAAGSLLSRPSR